jgi:hypothetical protein
MKTLALLLPNQTDATSFYRGVGPFEELRRSMDFRTVYIKDFNWAAAKGVDAIFMQRPYMDSHLTALEMAHANGLKVWVDFDDDLFNVPKSNRAHRLYSREKIQINMTHILAKADVVSVSTGKLKETFTEVMKQLRCDPDKVHIVPNAYDERFVKHYRPRNIKASSRKCVLWRGSETHDEDMDAHTEGMKLALANHLDWNFTFVGSPFWRTIRELATIERAKQTNVVEIEALDPAEYWKMIWKIAPALIQVPLQDNVFNRAKSNIAWIEGLHAGAVTLAPDWEEWQRPGVINYKSPADYREKLDRFMRGEFAAEALHAEGWNYLLAHLTLEKVNLMRSQLLSWLW